MATDTVKLLARYNGHANQELGRILAGLADEEWNRSFGGYLPSIRSLVSHIFTSDVTWLKRFATLRGFRYSQNPVFERPIAKGGVLFPTFADYERDRKDVDALFVQFADEVSPEDLSKPLRFKNYQGVDQERNFGGLVLHTFNHQTHHRGAVSTYLDILGKKNDFSSIAPLV